MSRSLAPAGSVPLKVGEIVCVVCRNHFFRPPNLAVRAKVCTKKGFKHDIKYKRMPDGSSKKVSCPCCRCMYKKTLAKNRDLDGKLIPSTKMGEFLSRSRHLYGQAVWLAFRLGMNAMLRVKELASLEAGAIHADAKPLPQIEVVALKKKVEIPYRVDIDPSMAKDLMTFLGGRRQGSLFGMPVRTLQHKFKQVAKGLGIGQMSIHSLRHTGIWNRGRSVTDMTDLNYLRQQARHESIEVTKLYLGYEEAQRITMAKKVKWY